jgi:undecaprenyl-phosphate 4-deoxy-4-formamido-L-arabinose transferase
MISIVMPTYNRSYNLKESYEAVNNELMKAGFIYELIFVDDGSQDGTKEILKDLCSMHSNTKGVILKENYGQQNATLAGIRLSKYPYIVTIDDDLSHDPKGIILMIDEIQKGYDVVYGVNEQQHDKLYRHVGTRAKELIFFVLLKKPFSLRLTSYRMMTRRVADYICKDNSPKVYLSAKILQYTRNIQNISIKYLTKGESSNYTVWKLVALLSNVVLNYTQLSWVYQRFNHSKQYEIEEIYQ